MNESKKDNNDELDAAVDEYMGVRKDSTSTMSFVARDAFKAGARWAEGRKDGALESERALNRIQQDMLTKKDAEIEEICERLGSARKGQINSLRLRDEAWAENERLKSENARMREALEFYGCEFNWHVAHEIKCQELSCAHGDKGERARAALAPAVSEGDVKKECVCGGCCDDDTGCLRKYPSKPERWMAEMQEVVDAELFIKESEVTPEDGQGKYEAGILKCLEMLRTGNITTKVAANWLRAEAVKQGLLKEKE